MKIPALWLATVLALPALAAEPNKVNNTTVTAPPAPKAAVKADDLFPAATSRRAANTR